jgi:hypothetical protein
LEVVMKAAGGFLLGAIALALVGGLCLAVGMLDREMVHAQEHVVSGDYAEPLAILDTTERYSEYISHLPWIGNGPVNDVRARKAALRYWQRQYAAVVPEIADPVGNVASDNIELQLVVANSIYRIGQAETKDGKPARGALDAAINGYLTVLKNASRQEDAAYNYEFLVRLRDDVAKGRRKVEPIGARGPHGSSGAPLSQSKSDYKIYVPLQSDEIDKSVTAGKAPPIKRKG